LSMMSETPRSLGGRTADGGEVGLCPPVAVSGARSLSGVLGLPDHVRACLFDLDGVLTQTATVHASAWKEMFDDFLREHAEQTGTPFQEFTQHDYDEYVDGKPRLDGTRDFLAARGITLPEGHDGD